LFEQKFEAMLLKYKAAIDNKKRFTGLVKDFFPEDIKNVNLLLMAYNMGIAQDMENVTQINNTFAYRYVKQLLDDFGLSRVNADWIVSVWCVCYGSKVLGKECDIKLQQHGRGPSIQSEKASAGKQYGDLFTYCKSMQGNGLGVTGFNGDRKQTIIFQNMSGNNHVIEICDNAFCGVDIEEAIITDGIAYIGKNTFAECQKLHQVVLPISVREIGDGSFQNCEKLKSLSLPIQLEKIGHGALKGSGLRSITIPKSVYWIGEEIFSNCKELESIALPENIDRIPTGMFEECSNLKKVMLHERMYEIGDRAFYGCRNLDIITIPDSVRSIGEKAFDNMNKMFIIQCTFGSFAEQYARKNKIKYQLA
jgi:hypothetical protein